MRRAGLLSALMLVVGCGTGLAQADLGTSGAAGPRPAAGNQAMPRAVVPPPAQTAPEAAPAPSPAASPPAQAPVATAPPVATPAPEAPVPPAPAASTPPASPPAPVAVTPPPPSVPEPPAPAASTPAPAVPPPPAAATPPVAPPPAAADTPPTGPTPPSPAASTPPPPGRTVAEPPAPDAAACAGSRTALEEGRKLGDLAKAIAAYADMTKPDAGCEPKLLFCQGRAVALMHLERAYAAADKGDGATATKLLAEGRKFGEPWPLLVALGDDQTAKAHTSHAPKDWGAASLDYQKAVLALAEPVLCDDEPARPAPQVVESLYRKMSAALMLGEPIAFAHTKCDPCAMAFLGASAGFTPRGQPLPIGFEGRTAKITPEGAEATKALIGCVLARKAAVVKLSIHTDNFGSAAVNKEMAQARVEVLKKFFADNGFGGSVEVEALGKAEPFLPDEPKAFTADERQRINRRVELRSPLAPEGATCQ